jgi:aminoglycoside phosphotransferase (APT) family kinase protein
VTQRPEESSGLIGRRSATPAATVAINVELVAGLLRLQCPDLADLPLSKVATGWDNEMYRLGDELAVRLPRRDVAAPNLTNEQRWLPGLAAGLPIRVPVPLFNGTPDLGYPFHWSVVNWAHGSTAASSDLNPTTAQKIAGFLAALHDQVPPAEAPINPWRGGPLSERTEAVEERLEAVYARQAGLTVGHGDVLDLWTSACRASNDATGTWIHGDLHPKNLIVEGGDVVMVIDWGDMCAGDPATDLAVAWMLFESEQINEFRTSYGEASDETWLRARGWAIYFGAVLLLTGLADDPAFAAVGRKTLNRVVGSW